MPSGRSKRTRKWTDIEWETSALAYADDVNIVGEKIDTIQKNTKAFLDARKKVGL
jgi:hypothetical protein